MFKEIQKWKNHTFILPSKNIVSVDDVQIYQKSNSCSQYINFLCQLQIAVKGKPISSTIQKKLFQPIREFIAKLSDLVDQIPPIQQPMRYGNKAFRIWHQEMMKIAQIFLQKFLPQQLKEAKIELSTYLSDSFGSYSRIDYGTGHQMAFMWFLWALFKLGYYLKQDYQQLVRHVFYQYIYLTRKILDTYKLQPAGSQGVWGLDDHYFLSFLIGAAQMCNHKQMILPDSINQQTLIAKYQKQYMYVNSVSYVMKTKTGAPLKTTSQMLHSISGAASWQKVTGGMIKMYVAQVLGKHPVIKHAYFGSLISFNPTKI